MPRKFKTSLSRGTQITLLSVGSLLYPVWGDFYATFGPEPIKNLLESRGYAGIPRHDEAKELNRVQSRPYYGSKERKQN